MLVHDVVGLFSAAMCSSVVVMLYLPFRLSSLICGATDSHGIDFSFLSFVFFPVAAASIEMKRIEQSYFI